MAALAFKVAVTVVPAPPESVPLAGDRFSQIEPLACQLKGAEPVLVSEKVWEVTLNALPSTVALAAKPVVGVMANGSITCNMNCNVATAFEVAFVTITVAPYVPVTRLLAVAFTLMVILVAPLVASVPLLAEAVSHEDVFISDQVVGAPLTLVNE